MPPPADSSSANRALGAALEAEKQRALSAEASLLDLSIHLSQAQEALAAANAKHEALTTELQRRDCLYTIELQRRDSELQRAAGERSELAGKLLQAEVQAAAAARRLQQAATDADDAHTALKFAKASLPRARPSFENGPDPTAILRSICVCIACRCCCGCKSTSVAHPPRVCAPLDHVSLLIRRADPDLGGFPQRTRQQ